MTEEEKMKMEALEKGFREMGRDIRSLQRQMARLTQMLRVQCGSLLSLDEAEIYTGYAKSYLYKLTAEGVIPCYRPTKRRVFVDKAELEAWIRRAGQGNGIGG